MTAVPADAPAPPAPTPTDFEALFHAAPAGYLLTLRDGTIVEANQTICDWTGRTRAELAGTSMLRLLPAGDRIMYLTHAMPELDNTGSLAELSLQVLGADGGRLPVLLAASRDPAAGDAPELDRIVLFRAPERRQYESELAAALRKLEAAEADRQRLLEEARHDALHDYLTGLPNRVLLADRLEAALSAAAHDGGQVGLLFCDVNGFKDINDTLGHDAGDQVLRQVAARLLEAVRGADTVARYSGDEFVVLVDGPVTSVDLDLVAARVEDRLLEPATVDGLPVPVRLAVGRALTPELGMGKCTGADAGSSTAKAELARDLLRRADRDMYEAKARA